MLVSIVVLKKDTKSRTLVIITNIFLAYCFALTAFVLLYLCHKMETLNHDKNIPQDLLSSRHHETKLNTPKATQSAWKYILT